MKKQVQPPNGCFPTAFAMILDVDVLDIFEWLGHDGSDVVCGKVRGFHVQELIDYCMDTGSTVTPIEFCPCLDLGQEDLLIVYEKNGLDRINRYLNKYDGVLTGVYSDGRRHAFAWYKGHVYDPATGDEQIFVPTDFQIDTFYIISN